MDYLYRKSFNVGGYGKDYGANWDSVFGKKDEAPASDVTRVANEVPLPSRLGDPVLDALLTRAEEAWAKATPEERRTWAREQKISFIYGNLLLDDVQVTKEQVAEAVDAIGATRCRHAFDAPCDPQIGREGFCRRHLLGRVKVTRERVDAHARALREVTDELEALLADPLAAT